MKVKTPKITLIGAGPGDPELISVKGLRILSSADVILYDALVSEELLDFAPKAKKIFVGKRKGIKAYTQDEINRLLVAEALQHGHAVRLKGGDSFVFGRGYEETEYARFFGIETNVVPGISSSISVPALAGIPVTHRGISNGFTVITAVRADGSLNPELTSIAKLRTTVVILMGLTKLREIAAIYQANFKGDEAVAVISNGSLPNQRTVTGTIETIADRAEREGIPAPAVIVIGDVVRLKAPEKQVNYLSNFLN